MEELLQNYTTIWQSLSPYLNKIFYPDAVEEIFGTLFDPKVTLNFALVVTERLYDLMSLCRSVGPALCPPVSLQLAFRPAISDGAVHTALFLPTQLASQNICLHYIQIRKLEKLLEDAHKQVAIGGRPSARNREMSENALPQSGVTL